MSQSFKEGLIKWALIILIGLPIAMNLLALLLRVVVDLLHLAFVSVGEGLTFLFDLIIKLLIVAAPIAFFFAMIWLAAKLIAALSGKSKRRKQRLPDTSPYGQLSFDPRRNFQHYDHW